MRDTARARWRRSAAVRVVVWGRCEGDIPHLGQQLAGVTASGATAKGLAVGRGEREHLAQTVVLRLENLDTALEVVEMCSTARTKGALDVPGTIWRQIVIALTAALRGRDRRHVERVREGQGWHEGRAGHGG